MFNSKENGFSLIELIVVLIITAILAQLGYSAFNRYVRRTRAFAAKTALKNIQRECESNRDLEAPETFTLLPIRGYSIATRDTNSCLGQSSDGKVAAIADNQNEIPNYFYDFLLGQISCSFNNPSSGLFKDCLSDELNTDKKNNSSTAYRTNDKGERIFDGPSCSMANESRVQGNYGMEWVSGGKHCNCDAKKGESYSYTLNKDPMTGQIGSSVNLSCYGQDGERISGKPSWSIPNTDNSGGRSGDNYDWLRYKKWVEDGGKPGEMHSNKID